MVGWIVTEDDGVPVQNKQDGGLCSSSEQTMTGEDGGWWVGCVLQNKQGE